jgi:hypothetical protein
MKVLIGLVVVVVLAAGGYWLLSDQAVQVPMPNTSTTTATSAPSGNLKSYSSPEYGIEFRYPSGYELSERDLPGSAQRRQHVITLMRSIDLPAPEGGEGPPAITIEMIQNDLDDQTTEEWIRNSSASNFKQSDGVLSTTTIAGQKSLTYTWDGLYRGDTTAIARPAYIYAFTVTYLTPEDGIRRDFEDMLRTVVFK